MAHTSPRSPIPWIALFVGAVFALLAMFGAATMDVAGRDRQEARMTLVPPQLQAPRLPDPLIPEPG